jgi:EAL domain-containing protein (putative c-di-GMP-specific phosphodiesterase class I)
MAASIWFLVGQLGHEGESVEVPINCSPFRIGRHNESSLCLPFRTVSYRHAEIHRDADRLLLRDLDSTNGTYVNGERIQSQVALRQDDLVQFADVALRVRNQASANLNHTLEEDVYDQALALVQFDRLMNERMVTPNYQPIVCLANEQTIAYEVLARSSLYGIETPGAMFRAAAKLNLEVQLSRMLRCEGIGHSRAFPSPPHLFVNTHPAELAEPGLADSLVSIREVNPCQPLTLEIHESAVSDLTRMCELKAVLEDLHMKLAFDDFGSGQARLVELIEIRPDYLKFDISLIRNIHAASPQRQQMVSSLVRMVRELGVTPLAEGVETREEHEACRQLGFEFGQGFYYGKPAPAVAC